MIKKILGASGIIMSLALVLPAFVQATGVPTTQPISKIACVGVAVATRESALGVAVSTHAQAVQAAYTARATALAAAYGQTTTAGVKTAVKAAWSVFNSSVKTANTAWRAARNSTWSVFRTAAKACKASIGVSDSANSDSEISGQ